MRTTPVTATVVMPGLVGTNFHAAAGMDADAWPVGWLTPEDVVAAFLAAVRRGEVLCTPSVLYKSATALLRTAPPLAGARHHRPVPLRPGAERH